MTTSPNAWIAIDRGLEMDSRLVPYTLGLRGERSLFEMIAEGDWVLVLNNAGETTRVGRLLRLRSNLQYSTLFFDRVSAIKNPVAVSNVSLVSPSAGNIGRVQWNEFVAASTAILGHAIDDVPSIDDRAYIRELLQLAVMDDLLGPAGGPHERIVDMGVRDRYLVGKLGPREAAKSGQEFPVDPNDAEDDPGDLVVKEQHDKSGATLPSGVPEDESPEEIDVASNLSLVPNSFGMTFCVDGNVESIEVEARWGGYERVPNSEHELSRSNGHKVKVWQRTPRGGKLILPLITGTIDHQAPDADRPEVRIQGSVRAKNADGDRLVTLFLVNAQNEPETNRDTAWLFQPELIVRAEAIAPKRAIFRRRPIF